MADGPGFPAAPWRMHGHGWVSLFRVRGTTVRPDGTYVAGFVSYEPPSALTYSELLVARVLDPRQVQITDIWVDSVASLDGGRTLWAIPKDLCDFSREHRHTGVVARTSWSARAEHPIAAASFTDAARLAPRLPFRGLGTRQPPLPDDTSDTGITDIGTDPTAGEPVIAELRGSAKLLPCRGFWDFEPTGPLGWLGDQHRLASFRVVDFRILFGV